MKQVIREGDTLREYGGKVLAGHYLCFGKGIATKGDPVKCNKHGMTTIIEGSSLSKVDGQPVALHGHRCACGCTLAGGRSITGPGGRRCECVITGNRCKLRDRFCRDAFHVNRHGAFLASFSAVLPVFNSPLIHLESGGGTGTKSLVVSASSAVFPGGCGADWPCRGGDDGLVAFA